MLYYIVTVFVLFFFTVIFIALSTHFFFFFRSRAHHHHLRATALLPPLPLSSLCSDRVWGVEGMRDHQYKIGEVLMDPNWPDKIIAVYPTGSEKSDARSILG